MRRLIAGSLAIVTIAAVTVIALPRHAQRSHTSPQTSSTLVPTRTTASSMPTVTEQIELTDGSRALISEGATLAPSRYLPTTIVRPSAAGHFPLVVFVHGYNASPSEYRTFFSTIASSGYVVAAPSFPLEDPAQGHALDRNDLPQEARDVSFVITSLESRLAPHLSVNRLAVIGHSDGADVALMVGYQPDLTDRRVRAVIADGADPITAPTIDGGAPLLLIRGSADQIVDPSSSAQIFGVLHSQRWSLTLEGADHATAITSGDQWTASLDHAVTLFLSSSLGGDLSGLSSQLGRLALSQTSSAPGP